MFDSVFGLVMVLVMGLVVAIQLGARRRSRRGREALLGLLAARLSGRVRPARLFAEPALEFEHRGAAARLTFYSTGGRNPVHYTDLYYDLGACRSRFAVRIYPEQALSRLGKALGAQDIQLGEPLFDGAFMIKGADEARVRAFLTPAAQQALFGLRRLFNNDHISVTLEGGELRLRKRSFLQAYDLLQRFVALGAQVADAYRLAARGGAAARPAPAFQPRCPVCEDALSGEGRRCPACGAAHHPECWQLNDGCGACSAGTAA